MLQAWDGVRNLLTPSFGGELGLLPDGAANGDGQSQGIKQSRKMAGKGLRG